MGATGRLLPCDGLVPTTLQPGEIVAEIRIPRPSLQVIYSKLRIRMSFDFRLLGAATGVSGWSPMESVAPSAVSC